MSEKDSLKKGSLGLFSVVFFVIAAASPLTGVVGALPVTFFIGNGVGVPGVFLIAGLLLLLFSLGFVAMSRYVINAGAFYAYIVQGLGVSWGFSGLSAALLAYTAMQLSVSSMFGFFTEQFVQSHWNINTPWWIYAIVMQFIVIILGILKVEIGGKVLGILLLLEIGIVLLLDFHILVQPIQFEFQSFTPSVFMNGNFGISMVFAICSFIGFEATAIYSEECKDPQKMVAKATLIAVLVITVFYAFTSWALIQFTGVEHLVQNAAANPGMFIYHLSEKLLGHWSVELMSLLLITSLFAAAQAFHNSLARYLFTMSRDGLLWSAMAKTHDKYHTPYISSIVQGLFIVLFLLGFSYLRLDPMVDVFAWGSVIGSIAILVLQIGVSFAVIRFFRKNKQLKISIWSRLIAPLVSAVGMIYILVLVVENINVLSGSTSEFVKLLPILVFGFILSGALSAQILKLKNPKRYASLGQMIEFI